jgi:hypothetical protein
MVVVATFINMNIWELVNINELESSVGLLVMCAYDVFTTMQRTPSLFKTLTNCNLSRFDELVT